MMIRPSEDLALYRAEMATGRATGRSPSGRRTSSPGSRPTMPVGATSSTGSRPLDHWPPATCPTPASSPGGPAAGTTVATSAGCSPRWPAVAKWRWPGAAAAIGSGTSRLVSSPTTTSVPAEDALHLRHERLLGALGLARSRDVGSAGEPAVVSGVPGAWRVDPAQLDDEFEGRTALLSPLDRLVFDRKRIGRAVRVRLPAGDVQARGPTAMGLLGAPRPPPRPPRRQGRRHRRPCGRCPARGRRPRGPSLLARVDGGVRDQLADLAGWLGLTLG